MRTYATMALVTALHIGAAASVMFVQGCRTPGGRVSTDATTSGASVTTAPMPPSDASLSAQPSSAFKPTYTPPPISHKPAAASSLTAGDFYVVQKGDSLGLIAKQRGVSVGDIASLNNIQDVNRVRVGQKLKIPSTSSMPAKPAAASATTHVASFGGGSSYEVQSGDSLSKIAVRFGVTVAALRDANKLTGDKIMLGQKLAIPSASSAAQAMSAAPSTPATIEFAAPAEQVAAPDEQQIAAHKSYEQPASVSESAPVSLSQPAAETPVYSTSAGDLTHFVREGDTMDSVAKLYLLKVSDLAKANGLSENSALTPGQRLKIP